ncbi:MAG TPA: hypothetical protein V6C76_13345 [Drouetiella sp.]
MLQTVDGMLSELTSSNDALKAIDEKRDELTEKASKSFGKISGQIESNLKKFDFMGRKGEKNSEQEDFADKDEFEGAENFEPETEMDSNTIIADDKPLDADKAQELADKLGAKPSAPADENLAAFHPEEERKSA